AAGGVVADGGGLSRRVAGGPAPGLAPDAAGDDDRDERSADADENELDDERAALREDLRHVARSSGGRSPEPCPALPCSCRLRGSPTCCCSPPPTPPAARSPP